MAMDPQQTSPMSEMDGPRLPSTPWQFWTCINIYFRLVKMKNIASKSNLALVPFSCSVKECRILPACPFDLVQLHTTGRKVLYF